LGFWEQDTKLNEEHPKALRIAGASLRGFSMMGAPGAYGMGDIFPRHSASLLGVDASWQMAPAGTTMVRRWRGACAAAWAAAAARAPRRLQASATCFRVGHSSRMVRGARDAEERGSRTHRHQFTNDAHCRD
jgi:hypothetical protein